MSDGDHNAWPDKKEKPKRRGSIWDRGVDPDELTTMTPEERRRRFPDDYAPNGEPYGDF